MLFLARTAQSTHSNISTPWAIGLALTFALFFGYHFWAGNRPTKPSVKMAKDREPYLAGLLVFVMFGAVLFNSGILSPRSRAKIDAFIGASSGHLVLAVIVTVVLAAISYFWWWSNGRDSWSGDAQYLTGASSETPRPVLARDTVVPEFGAPQLPATKRALRPAELSLLVYEHLLDRAIMATIVDLAVRGYLTLTPADRIDCTLTKLKDADPQLLPYESTLLEGLFKQGSPVQLIARMRSWQFDTDLTAAKKQLIDLVVTRDALFQKDPNKTTNNFRGLSVLAVLATVGLTFVLGSSGAGVIGLPLVAGSLLGLVLGGSMAQRTSLGREMYRRAMGFREFLVTAETDRLRFAEEASIRDPNLAYAIVFGIAHEWGSRFDAIEGQLAKEHKQGAYATVTATDLEAVEAQMQGDGLSYRVARAYIRSLAPKPIQPALTEVTKDDSILKQVLPVLQMLLFFSPFLLFGAFFVFKKLSG